MSWRAYLGSASCLTSLHESDATPGPARKASKEREKPDQTNAYWLDLGIRLLSYVQAKEDLENEPSVSLEGFFDFLRVTHPSATLEDVKYVASRLSTPTTVLLISEEGRIDPVDTALLLRPYDSISTVRLSRAGRQALSLSSAAGETRFADLDAQKMRRLIEEGDYNSAREASAELLTRLRSTGHDINAADERLGAEDLRQHFIAQGDAYMRAVELTQTVVKGALDFIDDLLGDERPQEDHVALVRLQEELHSLFSACQRLDRHLGRLLKRLNEAPASTGQRFRFDHLLSHWMLSPPSQPVMEGMANVTSPAVADWMPLDPAALTGSVSLTAPDPGTDIVPLKPLDAGGSRPQSLRIEQLLTSYFTHLHTEAGETPISLLDAISGQLPVAPEALDEIAAIYGATLGGSKQIRGLIEVSPGEMKKNLNRHSGHIIQGHDIMITRRPNNEPG
jgi:hypothetical protein